MGRPPHLVRTPLACPSAEAGIVRLVDMHGFSIKVGDCTEQLHELTSIPNRDAIAREIRLFVMSYKKPKGALNVIRPFLAHVGDVGSYDDMAVRSYREVMYRDKRRAANTRNDEFGYVLRLTAALQKAGAMGEFDLPANIKREAAAPKRNLYDVAPVVFKDLSDALKDVVGHLQELKKLDRDQATVAVVIADRLERLRAHAITETTGIRSAFEATMETLRRARSDPELAQSAHASR